MKNYTPFLKTKNYEFKAVKQLSVDIKENIVPFFDMHKKEDEYEIEKYLKDVETLRTTFSKLGITCFYLDDLDVKTDFLINGDNPYGYIMEKLQNVNFIPVLGLDRNEERKKIVIEKSKYVQSKLVAVRINIHDLEIPMLRRQLVNFVSELKTVYNEIHLIIDCRYCEDNTIDEFSTIINNFISKDERNFSKIIISGSSIPLSFSNDVKMHDAKEISRTEIKIWKKCMKSSKLFFGDYTLISDSYFDKSKKMYYRTITARVLYSYDDKIVVYRGGRLSKEGHNQYKEICDQISKEEFFRGEKHSEGDFFLANSKLYPKNIMPGTILAPTINSHITYMYEDFEL